MEADQQEQRREAEQDQEVQLLVRRRRHVRDEDRSDHDDGTQRPVVAEDRGRGELAGRPAQQAEDQQVVADRPGRRQAVDDQVAPRRGRCLGGEPELVADRLAGGARTWPTRIGTISAAKTAPRPWASQRFQPTFEPTNPATTPPSAAITRKSVSLPFPTTQPASSIEAAMTNAIAATSATAEPALVGGEGDARQAARRGFGHLAHPVRASARDWPGDTVRTFSSYSARA